MIVLTYNHREITYENITISLTGGAYSHLTHLVSLRHRLFVVYRNCTSKFAVYRIGLRVSEMDMYRIGITGTPSSLLSLVLLSSG